MMDPLLVAYLEPGSANYLLHLLVGLAAGALIMARSLMARVRSFFGRRDDR